MSWIPSYKKKFAPYIPPTWAEGTDAEIVEALEKHYAREVDLTEYWSVGDERVVSLSAISDTTYAAETHDAQDFTFVLTEVGGKTLADGETECCFQVDQKQIFKNTGYMKTTSGNAGGWSSSSRRNWCNNTYKNAIPSTLRPIFKEFINQSGRGGGLSGVENTIDYFALRAEVEIYNKTTYSTSGEGTQITWYKTSANRKKINVNGGGTLTYWLRSPYSNQGYAVYYSVTAATYLSGNSYGSIAPFGVI